MQPTKYYSCRIHRLYLCRVVEPSQMGVLLELMLMRSTTSLQLLPGPLWSGGTS